MENGAIGVANEAIWSSFPPPIFELFKMQPQPWKMFRSDPSMFVAGFVKTELDGQLWFLSKGHSHLGLPELAFRAKGHGQAEEVAELFESIFGYLYENGAVVDAGHTMEFPGGVFVRFGEVPTALVKALSDPVMRLEVEMES
jgi:hypothetical protein